jgi:thymidylate synthase (FAD)
MTKIKATYVDSMGSDLSVVNAARVSFGKKSDWVCAGCGGTNWVADWDYNYKCGDCRLGDDLTLSEKDTKLIKYLAKHKHLSPFGHAFASFHVKAPIFVARQLVKHKFLRWNEISRRYVDDEPEFYVPDVWRGRSEDKKQGSDGVTFTDALLVQTGYDEWDGANYTPYNEVTLSVYKEMLKDGVAPEQARMVLPQSTLTEWYWSGSLDAFSNMCKLRCASDTQYESRVVADQISEVMSGLYPVSWAALMENEGDNK